ncbi:MAG: MlaD family protein [Gemmatimonadota bacterium]
MSVSVQRTDLYVGMFLVSVVALVLMALVATSGWGTDRYDIYVRTTSAQDLNVDTKIFLQGLEVGRITAINPRPAGRAGQLEFILRLSLLDRFPDGTPLRLPRGTDAEVVQSSPLGGSQLQLSVRSDSGGTLAPGDTIDLRRGGSALDAFGALARDLKGTIEATLLAATGTLNSVRVLSESLAVASGTARRFLVAVQPGTEKIMAGVAVNLDRVRYLLDSTNTRTGITMQQVDSTIVLSRVLIRSLDSLTRVFIAMGGENRPEIAAMIVNFRELSEQLQFVLDQIGRRPLRAVFGVRVPDSLAPGARDSGRARPSAPADSVLAPAPRDSARARTPAAPAALRDTTRRPPPAPAQPAAPDTTRRPPPGGHR